ncbi:MAG TPA: helix-turn-helix domain-containing protein, partial [Bryobacteraceae bacterium]|nr:helix-turn-helix domain-containing protein [Bryobacteraceae bacterium]
MTPIDRTAAWGDPAASPAIPPSEEISTQVKRILDSPLFQNSDAGRKLLAFLARWSSEHPGQHIKETEVALTVFRRRPESFDPQTDSVVRVQMARLRAKLLEYYASEGQWDDVLIDIPKGSYVVVSSYRLPPLTETPVLKPAADEPEQPSHPA